MQKPNILVDYGLVLIEEQPVMRPDDMSASEWCAFWEQVQFMDPAENVIELKQKLNEKRNAVGVL